jgi:acetoacetyl-[acyl-carrier protein] synthase
MADDLALELGANIYGAVPGVFVNADGHKKSISGPGVGNYITFAKAAALAKSLLDERGFKEQTLAYAHGTGTPQNRTSESHIFNETAKAFGASDWLVPSIKCFVGHTMGPAGGDQLASALGVAEHGIVPGIVTSTGPADDVHHSHLRIASEHTNIGAENFSAALLNAKGFGGNNATAVMLSTAVVKKMLNEKHGSAALTRWQHSSENARQAVSDYDAQCSRSGMSLTYRFGHDVRDGSHIHIDENELRIDGYSQAIKLTP